MHFKRFKNPNNGFALLLTLVVSSVVLAIGLSLLSITLKQLTLSSTARDSEYSFHAANTGLECTQFALLDSTSFFNGSANVNSIACGDYSPVSTKFRRNSNVQNNQGTIRQYIYEFNNDGSGNVGGSCINVSVYTFDVTGVTPADRLVIRPFDVFTNTVEGLPSAKCNAGGQCIYIFSRGYNRACNELGSIRTVQRELTLTF